MRGQHDGARRSSRVSLTRRRLWILNPTEGNSARKHMDHQKLDKTRPNTNMDRSQLLNVHHFWEGCKHAM
jgi:hypothetical protein